MSSSARMRANLQLPMPNSKVTPHRDMPVSRKAMILSARSRSSWLGSAFAFSGLAGFGGLKNLNPHRAATPQRAVLVSPRSFATSPQVMVLASSST